ncbi:hypothetical protein KSD_77440 [Ktedonobacter sp. SOSP1-85]|nr:hypothetical protein KSD_77440 [Ktedonobacter sp. SOSP1-85]
MVRIFHQCLLAIALLLSMVLMLSDMWSQGGAPVLLFPEVGFSTVLPQTERTPFGVLSFPC